MTLKDLEITQNCIPHVVTTKVTKHLLWSKMSLRLLLTKNVYD